MTGRLTILGLGPGDAALITPEAGQAMAEASDVVGYIPYVARVPDRAGLTKHASDNRVELDRSHHALTMAAEGKRVVVVSSGDPGVFAMASAVFEALAYATRDCFEAMPGQRSGLTLTGGGARSKVWAQMFADATGLPLSVSESVEASSLGAAVSAAVGAGWYDGFEAAAAAMSGTGAQYRPDPDARAAWDALSARQAAAYRPN